MFSLIYCMHGEAFWLGIGIKDKVTNETAFLLLHPFWGFDESSSGRIYTVRINALCTAS